MTPQEAREHLHYLLSLCLRKEEAFGPLALEFARNNDLDRLGLLPEEQFNLWMALSDAFAEEPKRFKFKLEALQKAVEVLHRSKNTHQTLWRERRPPNHKSDGEPDSSNDDYPSHKPAPAEKHQSIV